VPAAHAFCPPARRPKIHCSGSVVDVLLGQKWPAPLFVKTKVTTVAMSTSPIAAEMKMMGGMPDEIGTPRSS